ncbi:hypothetical protein CYLTODRAFT_364437, partial [Cylindrobasidium torrendii FP15055 ss-10]
MKYVALLSGGKDSCFNLLHCAKNGHDLVAAASLGPGPGQEETDSYMYQTVGQDAVDYVAQALDVPLYRRVISGTAKEQRNEYGDRTTTSIGVAGDETEDLYELLREVKQSHPDVQGVSVGAILSTYQRVRVEHVCRRLSMTPLCYLWQRSQAELLPEMIDAGMHVVLIKVAGIGLTTKHLGKSLQEMRPTFFKLNELYGSHICGEGGEYESLTLDSPLFKSRIQLDETETVIHSDKDFATVAYLRVKRASLIAKDIHTNSEQYDLAFPALVEDEYEFQAPAMSPPSELVIPVSTLHPSPPPPAIAKSGSWLGIGNVQASFVYSTTPLIDEIKTCFKLLQEQLARFGFDFTHCVNINVYLSSMDLFAEVNTIYTSYFGTSPPARACIAVDLPEEYGNRIKMDCISYNGPDRHALHVQGLSYWAPANIGPYSQAILSEERLFVSGQIGMIPKDLSLPEPRSIKQETMLCTQHADRIVDAIREGTAGKWRGTCQSAIYWLADASYAPVVQAAVQRRRTQHQPHAEQDLETAPILFATVAGLPKGALVEKQVIMHTGMRTVIDDGEVLSVETSPGHHSGRGDGSRWTMHSIGSASVFTLIGRGDYPEMAAKLRASLENYWGKTVNIRLLHLPESGAFATRMVQDLFGKRPLPLTTIPCRALSSLEGECEYAIVAFMA